MLWNALIGCGLKRTSLRLGHRYQAKKCVKSSGAALLFLTLFAETSFSANCGTSTSAPCHLQSRKKRRRSIDLCRSGFIGPGIYSWHSVPRCQNYCIAGSPAVAATGTASLDT